MKSDKQSRKRYLHVFFLLLLIELAMSCTPFGYFHTGGIEISFLMLPVAVGAVCLGPLAGLLLGGVFGLSSFLACFGSSDFGAGIFSVNALFAFITCVPTRMAAGFFTGLLFRRLFAREKLKTEKEEEEKEKIFSMEERESRHWPSFIFSCAAASFFNTLFFSFCTLSFFYSSDFIQGYVNQFAAANPVSFFFRFLGMQSLLEIVLISQFGSMVSKRLYYKLGKD